MNTLPLPSAIKLELLALDLTSCDRCSGSLQNIEHAIDLVRPVLDISGVAINATKLILGSEEQAVEYHFTASPTIRINDADIVFDTSESHCESCTDLSGCDQGIDCRIWNYGGQEHTEAPVGLVVEAILRKVYGGEPEFEAVDQSYPGVPENIRRFFERASSTTTSEPIALVEGTQPCCTPSPETDTVACGCQ